MKVNPYILICEDSQETQDILREYLEAKNSYRVNFCSSGEDFIGMLSHEIDVALVDIELPGMSGVDVLKYCKNKYPLLPVIIMTAYSNENLAIECMRAGAYNYIRKPLNLKDIKTSIVEAWGYNNQRIINDFERGNNQLNVKSPKVINFLETLKKVANKNISILLTGETGTGKEYYAKMIHQVRNVNSPFIAVNCPAIPRDLAESELFGHEKGSFTGALNRRIGKLELSNNGILFLDEIADLDLEIQNKLLRSLQERSVIRIGGEKEIHFNSLLVSATSRNLKDMIQDNTFREDLYYRIADIELEVIPLRDRLEDLEMLVNNFIFEYASISGETPKKITSEAINEFRLYSWPGNLRELRSTVRKLCILVDKPYIEIIDLPDNIIKKAEVREVTFFKGDEKGEIYKALIDNQFNITETSKKLGVSRSTLYRKMKKLNI